MGRGGVGWGWLGGWVVLATLLVPANSLFTSHKQGRLSSTLCWWQNCYFDPVTLNFRMVVFQGSQPQSLEKHVFRLE